MATPAPQEGFSEQDRCYLMKGIMDDEKTNWITLLVKVLIYGILYWMVQPFK